MFSPEEPLKIFELLKSEVMNEDGKESFITEMIISGLTCC